jgi:hypothetical protein
MGRMGDAWDVAYAALFLASDETKYISRYLTGSAHALPTATLGATFGRQNLEHQIPDRRADPIQGGQNQNPTGPSTVVLSATRKSDQAAAANSP